MDFPPPRRLGAEGENTGGQRKKKGPQYLHDILNDIDPDAAARIHPNNVRKVIRAIEAAKSEREKFPLSKRLSAVRRITDVFS